MEIKEERAGDVLVLAPDGDLSTAEDCQALEQKLAAAVSAGARAVVVDCARVGHLTSRALRALLLASRKLARVKGRLVLCGMTAKVQKAFSISGFDRDFTVLPVREEAVRASLQPIAALSKDGARKPVTIEPRVTPAAEAAQPVASIPAGVAAAAAGSAPVRPIEATGSVPPNVALVEPAMPDPRAVAAARLLAALGIAAEKAQVERSPLSPQRAAACEAIASALLHAFGVEPA